MDQRSICLYLNRKGLSVHAIRDELVSVLGSDTVAYSMVSFYLRSSHWTAENEEQHSDPPPDDIDNAILQARDQTPFASVRELAKGHVHFNCTSLTTLDEVLGICCQAFVLGSSQLDRGATANSN
jgi:hypothetical protein